MDSTEAMAILTNIAHSMHNQEQQDNAWQDFILVTVLTGLTILTFTLIFWQMEEEWTSIDAFYFCMVTATSIGFGDLVPKMSGTFFFLWALFVVFALSLVTNAINQLQTLNIHKSNLKVLLPCTPTKRLRKQ